MDHRRYVPVVVGQDHCGMCLDCSIAQCGHRTWKSLILSRFVVVRQAGQVVEHLERYSLWRAQRGGMGKPPADLTGRDPSDYQHGGSSRARFPLPTAVIAVSTAFLTLVDPLLVCFLHYSIVRALIMGVDVV